MSSKRQLITFLGINLSIILILGIALYYLNILITDETDKIANDRAQLFSRNQVDENLALLRGQSEIAKRYEGDLDSVLPKRDQLINFSQDMGLIGNQNHVNLNAALIEENISASAKLLSLRFTMSAQGGFDNLIKTLSMIKNSRYIIRAENMELTRSQGEDFRLIINGRVFSFQDQK